MQIKTITTVAGVNEIDFGNDDSQTTAHYYWFKNLSNSTLYVSAMPDPVAGEDNVAELSTKGAASVETDEGKVYVLGAGKVEIHRTNSKFCPFELPSSGSGGGGGGSITVDSELSETSENPLQNKATTAAIKRIWDDMGMDLLFDGVTSADNPAVVDLANYKFVEIHHIMIANEKTYPSNIRLSLDNYLSSPSTIITQIHGSSINTIHTEEGMVSSLYAISAAGSNMNNTKIYGIK